MIPPAPVALHRVTAAHGRHVAVEDVSATFRPGSLTAVVGPNGAGKTTLLRVLAGLHPAASGRVDRGGMAPGRFALLPQAGALDRAFPLGCLDVAALGHWAAKGPFRAVDPAARDAAAAALAAVGLRGFERRPVAALSAGQFQRVLFARAVVQDASVLLLDEPFSAVDAPTQDALMALLHRWHAEGRTVVCVLHDLALARTFPDALLLARRLLAHGPAPQVLRPDALAASDLRWQPGLVAA